MESSDWLQFMTESFEGTASPSSSVSQLAPTPPPEKQVSEKAAVQLPTIAPPTPPIPTPPVSPKSPTSSGFRMADLLLTGFERRLTHRRTRRANRCLCLDDVLSRSKLAPLVTQCCYPIIGHSLLLRSFLGPFKGIIQPIQLVPPVSRT